MSRVQLFLWGLGSIFVTATTGRLWAQAGDQQQQLIQASADRNPQSAVFWPPRAAPIAQERVPIIPYENPSSNPAGGMRWGGYDSRSYLFLPGGDKLLTQDPGIWRFELLELPSGKSLGRFGLFSESPVTALSSDGKLLAAAMTLDRSRRQGIVELWDMEQRRRLRQLDEGVALTEFSALAFSPDGQTLAVAESRQYTRLRTGIALWNVSTGYEVGRCLLDDDKAKTRQTEQLLPNASAITFSPDGRSLAAVVGDQAIAWEIMTGQERCRIGALRLPNRQRYQFSLAVRCLAMAPDGRRLVIGCPDGLIRIVDLVTRRPLIPLAGHDGEVAALRFSADGKTLISFGKDGRLLSWAFDRETAGWQAPKSLDREALEQLWAGLMDDDPWRAHAAVFALAAVPQAAVPFLQTKLEPVPQVDESRLAELVAELQKSDFNERRRAAVELRKYGELALSALHSRHQLTARGSVEAHLATQLEQQYPTLDQVHVMRGMVVLQLMACDEADQLLARIAGGAPQSSVTKFAIACQAERYPSDTVSGILRGCIHALTDPNSANAWLAIADLARMPQAAVPALRQVLLDVGDSAILDEGPGRVERLARQLDDNRFETREAAAKALAALGSVIYPQLREALTEHPSAEKRQRLEELLRGSIRPEIPAAELQARRALEALELIGSPEAEAALRSLQSAGTNPCLKRAAECALSRLKKT